MKYISTRKQIDPLSFSEAITQGLASDGGLFVPMDWPHFSISSVSSASVIHQWADLSFTDFAAKVLSPFFADDFLQAKLDEICLRAFDFPLILKRLNEKTSMLELFHGPTNSFKDFGARFLALCMSELKQKDKHKQRLVLVATSGDTGGAVAAAFSQCTQIPVVILYPQNRISPRQEKQLASWGKNVKAFAVQGSFDDCQKLVKQAFVDSSWKKKYELISANSINLARLLPQMSYFAYSSLQYQTKNKQIPGFIVPSGNLGNAVAALWAKKIGFPISQVICAHNANHAVVDYFANHIWQPLPTKTTLANAMDVGNPSNFERMQSLYSVQDLFSNAGAYSVSDEEIKRTIMKVKSEFSEIICPHTATAFSVREKLNSNHWIVVATAHPAKFEEIIEPLIGQQVAIPESLQVILAKTSVSQTVTADLARLAAALQI